MNRHFVFTVTEAMVGRGGLTTPIVVNGKRHHTSNSFGPFQAADVGKRVYEFSSGMYQMENDQQLAQRLGASQ